MSHNPKQFLVTGCAGFIGGHMLEFLIRNGHQVTGVDDFSTGDPVNMAAALPHIRFIEGDVADPEVAAEAVRGAEYVIHLASIPSVPRSIENPVASARSSVMTTVALLEAARRAGVRRLVQASSSSVYGDAPVSPKSEDLVPDPLTPYAAAKLTQEQYARVFARCHELDTASLRYFNVFGPRQNPNGDYAAVIPRFIVAMLAGRRPSVFGDGDQTRDFTYVDNVVEANYRAALAEGRLGGAALNVAGGGSVSLNRLVALLNTILGADLQPEYLPTRPGDILHSCADPARAVRLIGYQTRVSLEEGLARTVAYFRDSNRA